MGCSRLAPDLVGDLANQAQLGLLLLLVERVPALMRAEAALRAHAHPLERLLRRLAAALGHPLGRAQHALLHLLLVLELWQLGADNADNDVLALGQVLQGLEPAGALGVVLEVEGVDIQRLEELLGNDVV